jgi:hypothetical protein
MTYDPYPGGGQGGYQAYPGGAQMPPAQRGPAPSSVVNAVRLMYAGAVVSAIGVIVGLTTAGSLKTTLRNQTHPRLTPSQVNTDARVAIVAIVVIGIIGIGLWIWMALMCKSGKNWARITGTVFFGIATISTVAGFARPGVSISRVFSIIDWLVGLAAVILLWRKTSSAYFKAPAGQ